jgi:glycosyltransferase involved in cell wall biosynthesis
MSSEQEESISKTAGEGKLPRVALIASKHTISEYGIILKLLLVGLADESVPVALVCPTDCDIDSVVSPAVEVIRHPVFNLPLTERPNRKILLERLVRFKPSVLHCLCESKALLTRLLARQLDLPYVLTVDSLQNRHGRFPVSSKRCAKIIVPAESIAVNLAEVYPKFADRIEQINIGTFVEEKVGCFRYPSRLAGMVTAYPLRKVSDFENLFLAVKHLAIEGYEFMLVITGSGRAERQLRKLLSALGLSQIVTIVPRLEPRRSVLAAGDIFIQPQPNTAFNPFLLEAMSLGVVVAGCKGGVDDLIIEDKTAVVFNPDDELSIRSSLQRLFDRREFARKIAGQTQKYLRENHTVSKMVTAVLQTYISAQNRLKD